MSESDVSRPRNDSAAAEADLYEQEREISDRANNDVDGDREPVPEDVDPADAHEQQVIVEYDEDDYR
ncbi:hypothetical protein CLV30_112140 [Haloactinopolyspora alba]|uniref:Uncharacterized protein n=1 Tax=Haloactinopolyspora alba TaxID=648780 RepID=A0A2P8DXF8_9ACTN|nr:hypothetical protein [Haloactinopolyspora alba]PSL01900.1 hypothetical protein CLV30_112140 [Haloactinopolyspora alba]